MSRNLAQDYSAIALIHPIAHTSTTTGSAVDVEVYTNDALIIADTGVVGTNGSAIVTVVGSLVATPSTYDQTLTTFVSTATSNKIAAGRANLEGIKNIKAIVTLPGSTSIVVSVCALVRPVDGSSSNNSLTSA